MTEIPQFYSSFNKLSYKDHILLYYILFMRYKAFLSIALTLLLFSLYNLILRCSGSEPFLHCDIPAQAYQYFVAPNKKIKGQYK